MKIFLIVSSFFLLTAKSCNTAAPRPPQIQLYAVISEEGRACGDTETGEICVYFDEMDGFITMSPEDASDLAEYVEELNFKCKRWEKK